MEKKRGSLMTVIVGAIFLAVVITAVAVEAFSISSTLKTNSDQTEAYSSRLLEDIKAELKNETQVAMSVCQVMYDRHLAGELTMEEAQKQAADIIRELKYNDGAGYFWVDTSKGINVVLLGRDTEGQSRWDSVDPNGTYFIQEMIKNGMQSGGGFTNLMFAKPNETEPLPKVNYTAYFEPFDWVMGTGVWVDHIDSLTEVYKTHATKGAEDMTNATNMMGSIKDSVENTASVVEALGEQLKNIDSFVETIAEIASQTNLLSLNASIEAARAGEMGKGFAVVASEISKLADQSNEAAANITSLIDEIMKSSNDAVEAMRVGAQSVVEGTETVNEAGGTFSNIVDMVYDISEQSKRMSDIVAQLSSGTETIAENIRKIEDMSVNVADETQNVSAASQQQTASTHEVAEASDKLADNAQELRNVVEQFAL